MLSHTKHHRLNWGNIGVECAIIYLFHRAHICQERPQSTVRITFFDLVKGSVVWITHYMANIPQYKSDGVISTIGAPQGTVLSLSLFTLYTSDFCFDSECDTYRISWLPPPLLAVSQIKRSTKTIPKASEEDVTTTTFRSTLGEKQRAVGES